MSVAIGIAHPRLASSPSTKTRKINTGTTMPPNAAASGTASRRGEASSPRTISRLISSPTRKKKTTIAASSIQCFRDSSKAHSQTSTAKWMSKSSW